MNERLFLEMMLAACGRHDVRLTTYSDGWLLRMEKDETVRYVIGANFDLNSQAAAAIARDKAATSALMGAARIEHVEHTVLRSSNMVSIHEFHLASLLSSGDAVMKPLEGGKGDYVTRIASPAAALRLAEQVPAMNWAISPYVEIERELRIVVVDGEIRLAFAKTDPVTMNGLKFFNLTKGAKAEPIDIADLPEDVRTKALAAVAVIGLRMAAVDLVVTSAGHVSILEVNAAFSLMHYAQTNEATYRQVASLYDRLVADMFTT